MSDLHSVGGGGGWGSLEGGEILEAHLMECSVDSRCHMDVFEKLKVLSGEITNKIQPCNVIYYSKVY